MKSAVKTVLPVFCEVTGKSEEPAKPAPVSLVNAVVPADRVMNALPMDDFLAWTAGHAA